MTQPNIYQGLLARPSNDFGAVRDGRTAPDFYVDIPLNVQGELIIPVAGNSFYCDANPSDGNVVVQFEDTNLDRTPTPFYVSPGFIARIPFTQIRVTWASQPGRKVRLIYGVDTEFQPGGVTQVSFAGEVTIRDVILPNVQTQGYNGASPVGFNVRTFLAAGAAPNGVNLKSASVLAGSNTGTNIQCMMVAAPSPPAAFGAGLDRLLIGYSRSAEGFVPTPTYEPAFSRVIPANWGIYGLEQTAGASSTAIFFVSFQVL